MQHRQNRFRASLLAFLVATGGVPTAASGQPRPDQPPRSVPAGAGRSFGGQTFIEPTTFDSVFVETQIGVRAGAGMQRAGDVPIAGRTFDVAFVGARGGLDLAARIVERVGLRGSVTGTVLAGADVPSAIVGGANGAYDWRAGAVVVVLRLPGTGTQVGINVMARGSQGRSVEPLRLATALHQRPIDTLGDVVSGRGGQVIFASQSRNGAGVSVGAAQTIGRHVSVQGGLEGSIERVTAEGWDVDQRARIAEHVDEVDVGAAVAVTADAAPRLPVAVQAEYRLSIPVVERERGLLDATAAQSVMGGVYYSGRRDLQLGVSGGVLRLDVEVEQAAWLGQFSMRYSF